MFSVGGTDRLFSGPAVKAALPEPEGFPESVAGG